MPTRQRRRNRSFVGTYSTLIIEFFESNQKWLLWPDQMGYCILQMRSWQSYNIILLILNGAHSKMKKWSWSLPGTIFALFSSSFFRFRSRSFCWKMSSILSFVSNGRHTSPLRFLTEGFCSEIKKVWKARKCCIISTYEFDKFLAQFRQSWSHRRSLLPSLRTKDFLKTNTKLTLTDCKRPLLDAWYNWSSITGVISETIILSTRGLFCFIQHSFFSTLRAKWNV